LSRKRRSLGYTNRPESIDELGYSSSRTYLGSELNRDRGPFAMFDAQPANGSISIFFQTANLKTFLDAENETRQ
jgi:hypothetical protein